MYVALLAVALLGAGPIADNYSTVVGQVEVKPVKRQEMVELPFLTWGGDVATMHANGGVSTQKGSIFDKMGLKFKLVNGDDFTGQVRKYLSGDRPYLRGTFTQLSQASEILNRDARTKPVMILQLTYSAGDHMVARKGINSLNDLKGKTICLQYGGPHVGFVGDGLEAAKTSWDEVKIVWAKNLTGADSPAEKFRNDPNIDVACVITPDMIGLCGGIDQVGSGSEGTVEGSHVAVSTFQMNRSIADMYVVREDYFTSNRADVEKFVAGYLKGCEELVAEKKTYADGKGKSPAYMTDLKMAQSILGEEVLPTLEVDAHGLVSDATFVGLPGNVSFFTDAGNLNGFEAKQKSALDLMLSLGFTSKRAGFEPPHWDYEKIAKLGGMEYVAPKVTKKINAESVDVFPDSDLDSKTIVSFSISFEPNQQDFPVDTYGSDFQRVLQTASTFGNAAIVIRGHADPTQTLVDFLKAGMAKGMINRQGQKGSYKYFMNGQPLDLTATDKIVKMIRDLTFGSVEPNPQETMQAALNLSQVRADEVKNALEAYAKKNKINLDVSQIQPSGVGIREPIIAKPTNLDEAKKNMRVEFRLIKVSPEALNSSDFDY